MGVGVLALPVLLAAAKATIYKAVSAQHAGSQRLAMAGRERRREGEEGGGLDRVEP